MPLFCSQRRSASRGPRRLEVRDKFGDLAAPLRGRASAHFSSTDERKRKFQGWLPPVRPCVRYPAALSKLNLRGWKWLSPSLNSARLQRKCLQQLSSMWFRHNPVLQKRDGSIYSCSSLTMLLSFEDLFLQVRCCDLCHKT